MNFKFFFFWLPQETVKYLAFIELKILELEQCRKKTVKFENIAIFLLTDRKPC